MTRGWDIEFCFWKKMEYADWLVQKNGINGWSKMVGPYADLSFATIFRPWDFGGALFSDKRIRVDHHFPLKIGHFGGIPFSNTAKYIVGIKSQISGFHIHEIRWNPINSYSKFYKVRLFSLHLWFPATASLHAAKARARVLVSCLQRCVTLDPQQNGVDDAIWACVFLFCWAFFELSLCIYIYMYIYIYHIYRDITFQMKYIYIVQS